jgi:hypothetical protein
VSVPTAELTASAAPTRRSARTARVSDLFNGGRFYVTLAGVALVIAAV